MRASSTPPVGTPPTGDCTCCRAWSRPATCPRVGLAEVNCVDGVPVGVDRRGVVLAPDEGWERGLNNAGVEDPRVTWVPDLDVHVMTYVAYGPLGPKLAIAVSDDLTSWRRLGPVHFEYQPDLDTDLNLFPNKDAVFFPEPVPGPTASPATPCCTARCGTSAGSVPVRASTCPPESTTTVRASGCRTSRWPRSNRTSARSPICTTTARWPSRSSPTRS